MKTEATSADTYRSPGWGKDSPKGQILTIEELLEGAEVKMPPPVHTATTFKQAEEVKEKQKETQKEIFGSA